MAIRQDPLQTLSYVLFELTGEKLYELFHFVTRNPYVSRIMRQKYGRKRAGKMTKGREAILASTMPKSQRRPAIVVEEEDDYELPTDEPYIAVEEETTAAAEKAKLETLEAELARLRAEMAQFMAQAAANMHAPNASASPASSASTHATNEYAADDMPHTPLRRPAMAPQAGLAAGPPVPPPPPPPSSFSSSMLQASSSSASSASSSSTNASSASSSNASRPVPNLDAGHRAHTHSLSDMVKASNRNTLRKVEGERSPGGTVKRAPGDRPVNQDDTAAVIAHALRRRFKSVSGSPDAKSSPSRAAADSTDFD